MTTTDTAAASTTDPAATPTDPPATTGDQGSLLAPGDPATAAATGDDWLPEKFRVNGEDGALDEAASARKLAESYKALEAHKGPLPQVPATPEDYTLEAPKDAEGKPVEGIDFEAFTADPLFKAFAKDAHAKGLTNEQLQFVTDKYLQLAPELFAADAGLSVDEAKAELGKLWPDEATMQSNLAGVVKAINAFGGEAEDVPGSKARLMEKYGRDPDFIAFAANIAGELKEDRLPNGEAIGGEQNIEALQKSKAYWDANHPDHARVKAQVSEFYTKKHGTKRR